MVGRTHWDKTDMGEHITLAPLSSKSSVCDSMSWSVLSTVLQHWNLLPLKLFTIISNEVNFECTCRFSYKHVDGQSSNLRSALVGGFQKAHRCYSHQNSQTKSREIQSTSAKNAAVYHLPTMLRLYHKKKTMNIKHIWMRHTRERSHTAVFKLKVN